MNKVSTQESYEMLEAYIDSLDKEKDVLIDVLHHAQKIFGCLPLQVQLFIGEKLNIPASRIYGVVTFYSYFTMEPRGEYLINVCTGTACFVKGARGILDEFKKELGIGEEETTPDNLFSLSTLRCVGACSLAPVVTVNDKVYGHVTVGQVREILEEYRGKELDENE